jgi:hypothetical protein
LSQDPLIELNRLIRKLRQDIPVEKPPGRLERLRAGMQAGTVRCASSVRAASDAVRSALGMRPSAKRVFARAGMLAAIAVLGVVFWAAAGIFAVRWMLQYF